MKVLLDGIFGRASFQNELVWAYDYGAHAHALAGQTRHHLWYARPGEPRSTTPRRIPYAAVGPVGPEKAARARRRPTLVADDFTNPRERTGYATQKPLAILSRIVAVHPGGP